MSENDRIEPQPGEPQIEDPGTTAPSDPGDPLRVLVGMFLPVGLLLLLLGTTVFLVWGEATATFLVLVVVGIALVALNVFYNADRIALWISRRGAILLNVVAMIVLATVILSIVSFLNETQLKKRDVRWDLTRDESLALSERTKTILRNLEDRLTILHVDYGTLRRRGQEQDQMLRQRVDALLTELDRASGQVVVYRLSPLVDPDHARGQFARADLDTENMPSRDTIILAYGGQRQDVPVDYSLVEAGVTLKFLGERVVTTKILELTSEKKNVYFLKGHDEKTHLTLGEKDYQEVNQALRRNNFEPVELSLARTGEVPKDCSVLVIGGPKVPLSPPEVEAVDRYLERGGSLLFLADPSENAPPAYGLAAVLRKYGIVPKTGFKCHAVMVVPAITVREARPSPNFGVPNSEYTAHPVVDSLRNRYNTTYFGACPVDVVVAEGVETNEIVRMPRISSSGQPIDNFAVKMDPAWRQRIDWRPQGGRPSEEAGDVFGRMSIAVAAERVPDEDDLGHEGHGHEKDGEDEKDPPRTRLVVIGDSDFCLTRYVGPRAQESFPANLTLFVNAVQWLGQRESYISIDPKTLELARERADVSVFDEDERNRYDRALLWIPLVFLPGLMAFFGLVVWWRRQR